jgi:3-oxoadipate enol-lactonase
MTVAQTLGYRILSRNEAAKDSPPSDALSGAASDGRLVQGAQSVILREPLVLLRGLGRSSRFWLGFEERLRAAGDVIMIDLKGTGMSPSRVGRWTVAEHARDVLETLKATGYERFHLVSISFGAMVAIELAGLLGKSCRSATFVSSSARFTGERRINPAALVGFAKSLRSSIPRNQDFARYIVSESYLKSHPELPKVWDALYRTEGFSRLATLGQLTAAATFDGKAELEALEIPTFFVVSRDDGLVSWRNSVVMSQAAKQSSLHVYEGPGHDLPTEVPDDLAARVIEFCGTAERAKST